MAGILLFFAFLAAGLVSARRLPCGAQGRICYGLAMGFAEMMWLPSLFAFAMGFTAMAQYCALGVALLLTALCQLIPARGAVQRAISYGTAGEHSSPLHVLRDTEPPLRLTLLLVLPLFALSCTLQYTHVFREVDGALHVGQSTYGDLCLHAGIATGLVNAPYPPEYTILPGTLLGYPFLFDALSASMLVLGAPLQVALALPAAIAMGVVYGSFVLLAWSMTHDARAVAISYVLVFLNGGLGFAYILDGWPSDNARLLSALFDYYRAPANMPDVNIRWVNVICDMMIPQRTLLAGWVMLLPAFTLLREALRKERLSAFIALGVWAGMMPMVHTHSFMALGLVSAGAMVFALVRSPNRARTLGRFTLYAGIAAALALPQLMTWTFPQTLGGGSLAFRINWVNNDGSGLIDGWLWFWVKNVGPVFLLIPIAAVNTRRTNRTLAVGALCVFIVAELIQFQPNEYDNNKLFYAAFLLVMPTVGELLSRLWKRLSGVRGRAVLAAAFLIVCTLSGGLSLARETISDYEIFSADEVEAAAYIREHTPRDAVFLTGSQHNNVPAALCGRKLVCGTGTYLYFHGVNYADAADRAADMFDDPTGALVTGGGVDYIYLSSYELVRYNLSASALEGVYPARVFGTVTLYAVSERARAAIAAA